MNRMISAGAVWRLNLRGHSRITHHPPALPDAAKYADRLHTQRDSIFYPRRHRDNFSISRMLVPTAANPLQFSSNWIILWCSSSAHKRMSVLVTQFDFGFTKGVLSWTISGFLTCAAKACKCVASRFFNEWNHCSNTFKHLTVNFFKTLNIKILQILTLNIKIKGQITLNTKPHPDPLTKVKKFNFNSHAFSI